MSAARAAPHFGRSTSAVAPFGQLEFTFTAPTSAEPKQLELNFGDIIGG
jgi:hypothetical protein